MSKYNTWRKDLDSSTNAIESIRETVLPRLISGDLISIENTDNEVLLMMDMISGIDLIRHDDKGLQGIAARVQFGSNYKTFTIRSTRHTTAATELEKRMKQIKGGYFYPAFTMQAYFNSRDDLKLLSVAVIRTIDLYDFIDNNHLKVHTRKSDNVFKYCFWSDLKKAGCNIKIIEF